MINFNAGDRITVVRSNGDIEHDWYLWTDMDQLRSGPSFAFTAPEMIGLRAIKPTNGESVAEMLAPGNNIQYIEKRITLTELLTWQQPDPRTVKPYQPGKQEFLKRVEELRKIKKSQES